MDEKLPNHLKFSKKEEKRVYELARSFFKGLLLGAIIIACFIIIGIFA